ncbi:MAG: CDP-glycerol glycerophosphotransferase family protein, partial [Holosporales bacterium]|nr:CDP-glycerol glycerophosphotransferase family protein [Holosporales bacterium]
DEKTVLVAPSWHEGNIFETCALPLFQSLLHSGFHVIARPHDETLKRNPKLLFALRDHFKGEQRFCLDLDMKSDESLQRAAVLITDWSGIAFEWAIVKERPTLFVNTKMKIHNEDYEELGIAPIEIQQRDFFGKNIEEREVEGAGVLAEDLLKNKECCVERIRGFRDKMICHFGQAAQVGGQYILDLVKD